METLRAGGGRLQFHDIKHMYSAHAGIQFSMNILCEPRCVGTTERNFYVGGVPVRKVQINVCLLSGSHNSFLTTIKRDLF